MNNSNSNQSYNRSNSNSNSNSYQQNIVPNNNPPMMNQQNNVNNNRLSPFINNYENNPPNNNNQIPFQQSLHTNNNPMNPNTSMFSTSSSSFVQGDVQNNNNTHGSNNSGNNNYTPNINYQIHAHPRIPTKKRRRFTHNEDQKLIDAIRGLGSLKNIDWQEVLRRSGLDRTCQQVKTRFNRIKKDYQIILAKPLKVSNTTTPGSSSSYHNSYNYSSTNSSSQNKQPVQQNQPNYTSNNQSIYPSPNQNNISNNSSQNLYTQHSNSNSNSNSNHRSVRMKEEVKNEGSNQSQHSNTRRSSSRSDASSFEHSDFVQNLNSFNTSNPNTNNQSAPNDQQQIQQANYNSNFNPYEEISKLNNKLQQKTKDADMIERRLNDAEQDLTICRNEIQQQQQTLEEEKKKSFEVLEKIVREKAQRERKDERLQMKKRSTTIGAISYQRTGLAEVYEQWQDGQLFKELESRSKEIQTEKEQIEKRRKSLMKAKSNLKKANLDPSLYQEQLNDIYETEDALKIRISLLKKEEQFLTEEKQKLLTEKNKQIKEIKRIRDEERSHFRNFPILNKRYLLMKLLGRGGFSEVYKAYDLHTNLIVACKIHQLNVNWNEQRKQNYIKHVLRECQIHKTVKHPRLVQMYDTFIYDNNTFVTVLEYCEGNDLDLHIKTHQYLPEKEAKNIVSQIFSGLNYLNKLNKKIIHFDLKPANILFGKGEIKITDFGLSKIMEDEDSIELTSQGAGTYWYLPPECFETAKTPKISSKVDVWSTGIIFYQMLYGKKPFGDKMSQQNILKEGTITQARTVIFPEKPQVSEEAKQFMRKCLAYHQESRGDVVDMYNDSYLRSHRK